MSEQQSQSATATATGDRWGDPISAERQAELQGYLDRWAAETEHGERRGPFRAVQLSGADVSWLAERVRDARGWVPELHLEQAYLSAAHLEGADLTQGLLR